MTAKLNLQPAFVTRDIRLIASHSIKIQSENKDLSKSIFIDYLLFGGLFYQN